MPIMKIKLFLVVMLASCQCVTAQQSRFQYIFPKPQSILNSRETNIIIRQGGTIDGSSLQEHMPAVTGSVSGVHAGTFMLSDDHTSLQFHSSDAFSPNETVTVALPAGVRTIDGSDIGAVLFSFAVSPQTEQMALSMRARSEHAVSAEDIGASASIAPVHTDSLPSDLPKLTVGMSNNPCDGKIFLANQAQTVTKTIGNYLLIYNNDGTINQYKKLSKSANGFKIEPNGDPSYNLKGSGSRVIMDTSLTEIDTIQGANGLKTAGHDFLLLPNGHAILMANDPQPVDMSLVVTGGYPDAAVTGCIIQELDASNNVVFQWRSWDYLPITASYFDLTLPTVDLLHQNALALDRDGNILLSIRHYSCIVKINRTTGGVDWILGGKLNQFTFINEHASNSPTYFSYQHNVDVLPNGNITLFDNGTQHVPNYSRGVEYTLDVQKKTAVMVWDYRHTPDLYADAMGSVQRLNNGNTLIGWGNTSSAGTAVLTEVRPDNTIALEMFLPKGQFCYRAYKYPWASQLPAASVTVHEVLQGNTYAFKTATDSTGIKIKFKTLNALTYASASVTRYNYAPLTPLFLADAPVMAAQYFTFQGLEIASFSGQGEVDVRSFPAISAPQKTVVYVRPQYSELFIPLPTSYDSTKNILAFTTSDFGDFAFAVPQSVAALSPAPISPKNNETVNGESPITLQWGTSGIVQSYRLQVAADSLFQAPVVDNATVTSTSLTLSTLINKTGYYWRVNSTNTAGTSAWSGAAAFRTASPFVTMLYPNGGERLSVDSTYVVRWVSNVHELSKVVLMKGNAVVSVVADSVVSGTNALLWQVPSALASDTSYKVVITNLIRTGLLDASDRSFAIGRGLTGVPESKRIITRFQLSQNFPNPFNPSTVIGYTLPVNSHVLLTLYDIVGREVRTLVDAAKEAGMHTVLLDASDLPGGVYFYRLHAGDFFQSKKLTLLK